MEALFRGLAGSRDSCGFDGGSGFEAVAVCHELRSSSTTAYDKPYVSFKVSGGGGCQVSGQIGDVCTLKAVQPSSVVVVRLWDSAPPTKRAVSFEFDQPECSMIGELRIPLRRLAKAYNCMLYHCWLSLRDPKDKDPSAKDADVFDRALRDAQQCGDEPKVRLTMCRASDLGFNGRPFWTCDASHSERVARWGALLRSQKQNANMCQAQQRKMQQELAGSAAAMLEAQQLAEQLSRQEREAQSLEAKLVRCQMAMQNIAATEPSGSPSKSRAPHKTEEPHMLEMESDRQASEDVDRLRAELRTLQQETLDITNGARGAQHGPWDGGLEAHAQAEGFRREFEDLQAELEAVGETLRGRLQASQDRLRRMREQRDDALQANEGLDHSIRRLGADYQRQVAENAKLAEEKESLMRIVEDLHESCKASGIGVPDAARQSVESIIAYPFP